jgi:hypothetical protein
MRWFGKRKRNDVWDEEILSPIGDLEAAQKIRTICAAAAKLARDVGGGNCGPAQTQRYERASKAAMQIAMKVSDDLLRDAALGHIIDLCMQANSRKTAQTLLRGIQSDVVLKAVLSDHPLLQDIYNSTG